MLYVYYALKAVYKAQRFTDMYYVTVKTFL